MRALLAVLLILMPAPLASAADLSLAPTSDTGNIMCAFVPAPYGSVCYFGFQALVVACQIFLFWYPEVLAMCPVLA
jgi:hypothetical protein